MPRYVSHIASDGHARAFSKGIHGFHRLFIQLLHWYTLRGAFMACHGVVSCRWTVENLQALRLHLSS